MPAQGMMSMAFLRGVGMLLANAAKRDPINAP